MANTWRGEDDEPMLPRDFMPWLEQSDDDEQAEPVHVDAMVDMLKKVFGAQEVEDADRADLAAAIAYSAKEKIDELRLLDEDDENWEP